MSALDQTTPIRAIGGSLHRRPIRMAYLQGAGEREADLHAESERGAGVYGGAGCLQGARIRGGKPRTDWKPNPRANKPGAYTCPCCGERLSGPARFYTCPNKRFG